MARGEVPAWMVPTTPVVPKPRCTGCPLRELLGYEVRRAVLLKAKFRVGMDVADASW